MFKCRKCNINKTLQDFVKDRTRKRGHHPYCRECQNKIKNNKRALERALEWQKLNKNSRREINKKWRSSNPELCRIYRHNRRLRVKESCDGTITKESLLKLNKDFCYICKNSLTWGIPNSVHLDHIIPLVRGGKHSIDNVKWSCSTCNLEKGSK